MSTYDQAVAFTDNILAMRKHRFPLISIGQATVELVPHDEVFDGEQERLKWSEGKTLKAIRFDLYLRDLGKESHFAVYLAAGEWGGPHSHYLIVYFKRYRTVHEFNIVDGLVTSSGESHLWTSGQLFPNRDAMLKARLIEWMERLERGLCVGARLRVGSTGDMSGLLANILTLALLKEHLRGRLLIEALAGGLSAVPPLTSGNVAAALLGDAADEVDKELAGSEDEWEGLKLTSPDTLSRKRRRSRRLVHVNFADLEALRAQIGEAAERMVVQYERDYLRSQGKARLAALVEHTARTQGDGAGYDVCSFTVDGKPLYIEVKATTGKASTPFYLTETEWAFARRHPRSFRLYRVSEFDPQKRGARLFIVEGRELHTCFDLEPVIYRARMKRKPPELDR